MADRRDKPVPRLTNEQRARAADPDLIAAVRKVAAQWCERCPAWLGDEIESAALLTLCRAVASYDPDRGSTLKTWVLERVSGGIIDGLRDAGRLGLGVSRACVRRGESPGVLLTSAKVYDSDRGPVTLGDTIPADDLPVGWEIESEDYVVGMSRKVPADVGAALRAYLLRADLGGRMCAVSHAMRLSESRVSQMLKDAAGMLRDDGKSASFTRRTCNRRKPAAVA